MKILWTDGSASPNPGPGGWAVIEDGKPVRLGRRDDTTNIIMEGCAMIAAIEYAGEEGCEIHSDSHFWIDVLTKWAPKWRMVDNNGNVFWGKRTGGIKNLELVIKLYNLYKKYPVKLVFVHGHEGTEMNELADKWANNARNGITPDSNI